MESMKTILVTVIPAKAGIQLLTKNLDARLRGHDNEDSRANVFMRVFF